MIGQGEPAAINAVDGAPGAPGATVNVTLRNAAAAVLTAWDDQGALRQEPRDAVEQLRALLTPKHAWTRQGADAPRKPREGTKQQAVLTLLRRGEGATVAQIAEATGWATHTVRGFLAWLKEKGFQVSTLQRVRMVGPNTEGVEGLLHDLCCGS
jgi:hypothetical protein